MGDGSNRPLFEWAVLSTGNIIIELYVSHDAASYLLLF